MHAGIILNNPCSIICCNMASVRTVFRSNFEIGEKSPFLKTRYFKLLLVFLERFLYSFMRFSGVLGPLDAHLVYRYVRWGGGDFRPNGGI